MSLGVMIVCQLALCGMIALYGYFLIRSNRKAIDAAGDEAVAAIRARWATPPMPEFPPDPLPPQEDPDADDHAGRSSLEDEVRRLRREVADLKTQLAESKGEAA